MSGVVSFKREPSSTQPINRKSPSQMEIPSWGNFGEGPSSRPYLGPLRMSPPMYPYDDPTGKRISVPRQPLRSTLSDDVSSSLDVRKELVCLSGWFANYSRVCLNYE